MSWFALTNPAGGQGTVRIWDNNGMLSASIRTQKFTPQNVSGILKDGEMLVLTATLLENGRPIRAAMTLIPDGEIMKLGLLLEFSETVKRGLGKKQ